MKSRFVQRALYAITVQKSLRQACLGVGTGILGGVVTAFHPIQRNQLAVKIHLQRLIGGNFIQPCGINPGQFISPVVSGKNRRARWSGQERSQFDIGVSQCGRVNLSALGYQLLYRFSVLACVEEFCRTNGAIPQMKSNGLLVLVWFLSQNHLVSGRREANYLEIEIVLIRPEPGGLMRL